MHGDAWNCRKSQAFGFKVARWPLGLGHIRLSTCDDHQGKPSSHSKEQLFGASGLVAAVRIPKRSFDLCGMFFCSLFKMFLFEILYCDRWKLSFCCIGLGLTVICQKGEGRTLQTRWGAGSASPLRICKLKRHRAPGEGLWNPELTYLVLSLKEILNLRIASKKSAHIIVCTAPRDFHFILKVKFNVLHKHMPPIPCFLQRHWDSPLAYPGSGCSFLGFDLGSSLQWWGVVCWPEMKKKQGLGTVREEVFSWISPVSSDQEIIT